MKKRIIVIFLLISLFLVFLMTTCKALPVGEPGGLKIIPANSTSHHCKERIVPNVIKGESYWYWMAIQSDTRDPDTEKFIRFKWQNGTEYLRSLRVFTSRDLHECKEKYKEKYENEADLIENCKNKISKKHEIKENVTVRVPPNTQQDDLQIEMETMIPVTETGNDFLVVFRIVESFEEVSGGNAPLKPPTKCVGYRLITTGSNYNKYIFIGAGSLAGIGVIVFLIIFLIKKRNKKRVYKEIDEDYEDTFEDYTDSSFFQDYDE